MSPEIYPALQYRQLYLTVAVLPLACFTIENLAALPRQGPRQGCGESSHPCQGAHLLSPYPGVRAQKSCAYARLIYLHASGVRQMDKLESPVRV